MTLVRANYRIIIDEKGFLWELIQRKEIKVKPEPRGKKDRPIERNFSTDST